MWQRKVCGSVTTISLSRSASVERYAAAADVPAAGLSSSQTLLPRAHLQLPAEISARVLAYSTEIPRIFRLPHAEVSMYSLKATGYASQRTSGIAMTIQ